MEAVLAQSWQILQDQKFIAGRYCTIYLFGFVASWDKAPNLIITLPEALEIVRLLPVVFITGAFNVALILAEPTTCNVCPGAVVPMPTLPLIPLN